MGLRHPHNYNNKLQQKMMSWTSLTTPNGYGECALDDVLDVVENITQWLKAYRVEPELEEERWVRQILHYILARQSKAAFEINLSHVPEKPVSWTAQDETYWHEWIWKTFDQRSWEQHVMRPVFGSDQRLWEVNIDEWRTELLSFLPMWIRRDVKIVDPMYPPMTEAEARGAEEMEQLLSRDKEIDPYILEQEEKRARGRR